MPNDFGDRRNFLRLARILDVKIINLNTNKEARAQTHDISANGIGFITNVQFNTDTSLELWLYIPDSDEPVHTTGKVVWTKMVAPNVYRVGVNLDKIDFAGISRILRLNT
jgi:c-di-GMP-binding flagellar brake protein YcgR